MDKEYVFISKISVSVNVPCSTFSNQNRSASLIRKNSSLIIFEKSGPGPSTDSNIPPTYKSMLFTSLYRLRSLTKISGSSFANLGLISSKVFIIENPLHLRTVL
uniref:Uncharacterized protein n=1 Tax=Lepeophtheirus salmonis TaxID=72036 RepID=A0A0K2SZE6_LEPSM